MSVCLAELEDDGFDTIEVMAPDYDKEYIWLWLADDPDIRIDLSRKQARQLRDVLDETPL